MHVPGSDLDDVRHLGDQLDVTRVEQLGDEREARLLARLPEDLQALAPEALKGVGRRARLERPASKHRRARLGDRACRLERLLARLDGARARDQPEEAVPDPAAAYLDDGGVRREIATDETVREELGGAGRLHASLV